MAKLWKPISLQSKRPKFCHFYGLKAVWQKNHYCKPHFFREIMKAVCLTFDWVPKLIQISFQVMEQKLVQRCETKGWYGCLQGLIWEIPTLSTDADSSTNIVKSNPIRNTSLTYTYIHGHRNYYTNLVKSLKFLTVMWRCRVVCTLSPNHLIDQL